MRRIGSDRGVRSAYTWLAVLALALAFWAGGDVSAQGGDVIGAWIEYELPDTTVSGGIRAVGDNCVIFMAHEDSLILAFDVSSGEWYSHIHSFNYSWDFNSAAGDNVALIWSDSALIGFSGITHSFAETDNTGGILIGSSMVYGCSDDMAYFTNEDYWYVFDGENAQWHSYPIPAETWEYAQVLGYTGYVMLRLRNASDEEWYILFSYSTKTFFELSAGYAGRHIALDFGCVFWNNSIADGSKFFGGYSALDGSYESHLADEFSVLSTTDMAEGYDPRTCFMFTTLEEIAYNSNRTTMYGFDTRNGHFTTQSFTWQPGCDTTCVYDSWNGGEFSIQVVKEGLADDSLGFYVYSGAADEFYYFTSPMVDPGGIMSPRRHLCGGQLFVTVDLNTFMGYDVVSHEYAYASMPPYEPAPSFGMQYCVGFAWGGGSVQRAGTDTVHVYSYRRQDNSLQELVEYSDPSENDDYYDTPNAFAFLIRNAAEPDVLWFYAPGTDEWSSREIGEWNWTIGTFRDVFFYYDEDALELVLLDGVTAQEVSLPNGRAGYDWIDYIGANDNFVISMDTDTNYNAYSTITRNVCQHKDDYLPIGWEGETISVFGKSGTVAQLMYQLTYNANHDCFVPLQLSEEQGYRSSINVGDNTALIVTSKGRLLAFDPHAGIETAVDDEHPVGGALPEQFSLSQNYPNPFNPTTVIGFDLPRRSKVVLEVLNLLGQRVSTLVDEELPAGIHKAEWDGCNDSDDRVASGLYFYRLSADGRAKSKKMMLLK